VRVNLLSSLSNNYVRCELALCHFLAKISDLTDISYNFNGNLIFLVKNAFN
jgi:hypothetical protein